MDPLDPGDGPSNPSQSENSPHSKFKLGWKPKVYSTHDLFTDGELLNDGDRLIFPGGPLYVSISLKLF